MLDSIKAHSEMRRKAGGIYGVIVTQARQRNFYARVGVPDTPSGRYELVVLHLFLVLERLRTGLDATHPLPRMLVEAFIADMDDSLRELATGDLTVPKKVRKAATGLYERSMSYRAGLAANDVDALAAVMLEHVFAGERRCEGGLALAAYLREASAALDATQAERIVDGHIGFPPAPVAFAEAL
jgi:cytochrome b pre-mRNA-processing protein 3